MLIFDEAVPFVEADLGNHDGAVFFVTTFDKLKKQASLAVVEGMDTPHDFSPIIFKKLFSPTAGSHKNHPNKEKIKALKCKNYFNPIRPSAAISRHHAPRPIALTGCSKDRSVLRA
jgi:hypothetical protein